MIHIYTSISKWPVSYKILNHLLLCYRDILALCYRTDKYLAHYLLTTVYTFIINSIKQSIKRYLEHSFSILKCALLVLYTMACVLSYEMSSDILIFLIVKNWIFCKYFQICFLIKLICTMIKCLNFSRESQKEEFICTWWDIVHKFIVIILKCIEKKSLCFIIGTNKSCWSFILQKETNKLIERVIRVVVPRGRV